MNTAAPQRGTLARLGATWSPRERVAVTVGVGVLLAGLIVGVGMLPAWRTLRAVAAAEPEVLRTLAQLQSQRDEARRLQAQPRPDLAEALRSVERSARERLGPDVQVQASEGRVNVVFRQASGEAVAQWLAQVRAQARAWPLEARLTRAGNVAPGAAAPVTWDGAVLLQLPAHPATGSRG